MQQCLWTWTLRPREDGWNQFARCHAASVAGQLQGDLLFQWWFSECRCPHVLSGNRSMYLPVSHGSSLVRGGRFWQPIVLLQSGNNNLDHQNRYGEDQTRPATLPRCSYLVSWRILKIDKHCSPHLDCFGLFQPSCQAKLTGTRTFTRFEGNITPCWEGETFWHGTSRKSSQLRSSFLPVTQVKVDFLRPKPFFWRTGDVPWRSQRRTAHGTTQDGAQEKSQSSCGKPRNFTCKCRNESMATSSWNQASLWT